MVVKFHRYNTIKSSLNTLAPSLQMLGQYEESLIDLETLLKIDPGNKSAKKEVVLVEREVGVGKAKYCKRWSNELWHCGPMEYFKNYCE